MTANLTLLDMFCGAGGSSTGATQVGGVRVRLAMNHWDKAIETHNANHPDTDHLQADISQTDPRYVPHTDLLWASPECTNHSRAKGRKAPSQPDLFGDVLPDAAAERSRATMWDVVRFTEAHSYRAVLVENVVEVVDWASPTGTRGGLFHAWLTAMHSMGYRHRIISLNSMHAAAMGMPAPQSRDRVYIAFWREGERAPDFERMQRPKAYCLRCDAVVDAMQWWKKGNGQTRPGRYRAQYLYRCPNAACRNDVVEPFWLPAASIIDWTNPGQRIGDRAKPLADKTLRRIQVGIERYWAPLLVEAAGNTYDATNPRHPGYGGPASFYRVWPTSDPTRTMHTTARLASDPLSTATASGNHHGLVMTNNHANRARPTWEPAPTMTTAGGGGHALIQRQNNSRGDQSSMTTPASEPVRTITTSGHQALLDADRPTIDVDDVRFRMLEPDEIKRAMAFPGEYVMVGNRREQVKLAGNAVTPPAARDLIACVVEAITGEAVAA